MRAAGVIVIITLWTVLLFYGCSYWSKIDMNVKDAAVKVLKSYIEDVNTNVKKEKHSEGHESYAFCKIVDIGEVKTCSDGLVVLEFAVILETRLFDSDKLVESREFDQDNAWFCVFYDKDREEWLIKIIPN